MSDNSFKEIVTPTTMRAYDIECNGCIRHEKDIMLSTSFVVEDEEGGERTQFIDIFLTTEEAFKFQKELDEALIKSEKFVSRIFEMDGKGDTPSQIARDIMKNVSVVERVLRDFKPKDASKSE